MPALELQQLVARLYTDPRMLDEFLADRHGFCARHAHGCGELLLQLDPAQLEFFAASLRSKRAGEVKKLLPMTERALGSRFADEFNCYASTTIPSGDKKHLADAMAFCEALIERSRSLDDLTLEAAAFELMDFKLRFDLAKDGGDPAVVEASQGRRPWIRIKRFSSKLPALTGNEASEEPKPERTRLVLFARLPGLRGIWYWELPHLLARARQSV